MQPKVLVAINFHAPAPWAADYAVKLAARLQCPLIFLGVLPAGMADPALDAGLIPADIPDIYRQRLEEVVRQSQKEGVKLEIFLSPGSFFNEISHFLSGPARFKFLVIGMPQGTLPEDMEAFAAALKELHRVFTGEILLVREQGRIAQITEFDQRPQGRKS
jgi:nucleotide-binding universal stress UspA family protein